MKEASRLSPIGGDGWNQASPGMRRDDAAIMLRQVGARKAFALSGKRRSVPAGRLIAAAVLEPNVFALVFFFRAATSPPARPSRPMKGASASPSPAPESPPNPLPSRRESLQ